MTATPPSLRPRPRRSGFVARGAAFLALGALAACAERPTVDAMRPVHAIAGTGTPVRLLVATTRERSAKDPAAFTDGRARELSYREYSFSIPPGHASGQIEWPKHTPGDPARDMVVTGDMVLDKAAFARAVTARRSGEVLVFIHGYNTNQQEAVFRVAQVATDSAFPGSTVAFTWPSRGTLTGYVADRESTTYSRDYLERFLNDLAATPGVKRINIIAHSMGNWLAVETLRQARLRQRSAFVGKLGEVMLIAPDIDIDVFRTQLDIIGRLPMPITILTSTDDRALAASQRLAGDVPRVGNVAIDTPAAEEAVKKYNLRVIDLSKIEDADIMRHSKFLALMPKLQHMVQQDEAARRGNPISRTGVFITDTAGNILLAPLRLGQAVLGQ